MQVGDLKIRKGAVEDAHLVEKAAFETDRTKAFAEDQSLGAGLQVLVEVVAQRFRFRRLPVQMQMKPGRLARAIVACRHVNPLFRRQWPTGAHGDGVAGPEADQAQKKPALIERTLQAMKTGIGAGAAVEDDPLFHHLRHLQPESHRKRLPTIEHVQVAGEGGGIIAGKAQRLADLPGTSMLPLAVDPGFLGDARFSRRLPASSRSSG